MVILGVALAGGLGALVRWQVSIRLADRAPGGVSTTLVNLVGAFTLGVVTELSHRGMIDPLAATVVGTGLLGALTTFSTWMVETLEPSGVGPTRVFYRTTIPTLAGVILVWMGTQVAGLVG